MIDWGAVNWTAWASVAATGVIATFTIRLYFLERSREESDVHVEDAEIWPGGRPRRLPELRVRLYNAGKQGDSVRSMEFIPPNPEHEPLEADEWSLTPPGSTDTVGTIEPGQTADLLLYSLPRDLPTGAEEYDVEIGLTLDDDLVITVEN